MIPVPDEMLMAYADGELTPEETKALENLINEDVELRSRLEPFVHTRTRLATAFQHTLHEPVPDRLIAAIARAPVPKARPQAVSFGERIRSAMDTAAATLFPHGFSYATAMSAALLLAAGATAGWLAGHTGAPPSSLVAASEKGLGLDASGALARALETSASGTASPVSASGASIVPVLSFRTQNNAVCREYRVAGAVSGPDFAGLACRTLDGTWRVALHVETPKQTGTSANSYQTATAGNVPAVDALVETLIAGDALGSDDESRLLKNGWHLPSSTGAPQPPAQ